MRCTGGDSPDYRAEVTLIIMGGPHPEGGVLDIEPRLQVARDTHDWTLTCSTLALALL
eukprot:COSAG02_NODE_52176_length_309_cov_0.985714_1_plen_58_part_00